jgi:cytochrome c
MKKFLIVIGLTTAVLEIFASVFVHPSGSVRTVVSNGPLLAGAKIDPAVLQVVERSCQNCHSQKTEWPWYGRVAPMSWMVEGDVAKARGRMNLSYWDEYTVEHQQEILASIATLVRSGEMPPSRYTAIHRDAKLSAQERDLVYEWSHAERRRLRSLPDISVDVGLLSGAAHLQK